MKRMAAYLSLLPCLVLLDGLWLFFSLDIFYRPLIGHLLADNPNWLAGVIFYLIYAFGVYFFVVKPNNSGWVVIMRGAIFGLISYGTFELTNWALMKAWPLEIVLIDMAWGAVLTSIAAFVAHKVAKKSGRLFF